MPHGQADKSAPGSCRRLNEWERAALKAAQARARAETPCFPCAWGSKRPRTPHGFHDASTDPAVVEELWHKYGGALVGIPTGSISGYAVLDIDERNGGFDWLAKNLRRLPRTRIHKTRSGGVHYVFMHVSGLKSSAGRVAPGIDIRAEGGYFIDWSASDQTCVLNDSPAARFPSWLAEQLIDKASTTDGLRNAGRRIPDEASIRKLVRFIEHSREGERNTILFWAACRMAGMIGPSLSLDEAIEILVEAARVAGLTHAEAHATVRSGLSTGGHQ